MVVQKKLCILESHRQVEKRRLEPNVPEQNIFGLKDIGDGTTGGKPISGFPDIGSRKKKERSGFVEAGSEHDVDGYG